MSVINIINIQVGDLTVLKIYNLVMVKYTIEMF